MRWKLWILRSLIYKSSSCGFYVENRVLCLLIKFSGFQRLFLIPDTPALFFYVINIKSRYNAQIYIRSLWITYFKSIFAVKIYPQPVDRSAFYLRYHVLDLFFKERIVHHLRFRYLARIHNCSMVAVKKSPYLVE